MHSDPSQLSGTADSDSDAELPKYTRGTSFSSSQRLNEHCNSLEDRKGRKWASLFVKSRSTNAKMPPLFLEHDVITGRVELDLEKPETIKAVTISVKAGTTAVGQEEQPFINITKTLWTPSVENLGGKRTLSGRHSWPFSIELPHRVTLQDPHKRNKGCSLVSFRLPPTFTERASPAYIDYRLITTIKRGALKVDQVLSTNFNYQPVSYPDPPSALRQLSYVEGSGLIGPDGDPEGWKVLEPVSIKGTLFDAREVQAKCLLAIATPLCFALGGQIPLRMTIVSSDTQALDILSSPTSVQLHLVRSMATGSDATGDANLPRRSTNFFKESAGQASFWPCNEGAEMENERTLEGELQIGKTLKPSFVFPRFAIRYTLDLLPFKAAGFRSAPVDPPGVLVTEKVVIVTAQTPGVQPRSHAPPGYTRPQGGDYNTAVGYLENGDQRFCQHISFK